MKLYTGIFGIGILALGACTDVSTQSSAPNDGYIKELPQALLDIVAPKQDLNTVRLDPADGCFIYRYVGPVETTFLPLRSTKGNPICTKQTG